MDLFLGNKSNIGAEVIVEGCRDHRNLMGYARLWFNGHPLGDFSDYIYLDGYLLGGLFQMLRVGELTEVDFPSTWDEQLDYFNDWAERLDEKTDSFRVSFGTLADAFDKWAYKKGDTLTIIWKLREGTNQESPKGYAKEAFGYTIDCDEFKEFVDRLSIILNNW